MKRIFALAALSLSTLSAEEAVFRILDPLLIEERFARIQKKNDARANTLRSMFTDAGCPQAQWSEPKVRGSKLPNMICTLPGSSGKTVVVTAHFDNAGPGDGAIDNWSGASLLPSLYESLSSVDRKLTFVFLLTTDEETGLRGATDFVKKLTPEQRKEIVANVNIDSIGLEGPTRVWHSRADQGLRETAFRVAQAIEVPFGFVNVDKVGDSDSHPFLDKKIPVIDFHSLTSDTLRILHSREDVARNHDPRSYYDAYRLLAVFLAYLDTTAPGPQ